MSISHALANFGETRGFVKDTPELRRVLSLPRASAWVDSTKVLSDFYRKPGGSMTLRPVQAQLIETCHDIGGVMAIVGVGEGKTLASYLAGTAMDAKRVAVIVPSKLRDKTHRDFAALRPHWYGPTDYRVFGYTELGVNSGEHKLDRYAPDVIVLDEFHHIGNPGSSVSKRVVRYLREHTPPLMAMSGSAVDRSLMSIHHILALTLGVENMPLPAPRTECKQWARAVDEKVPIRTGLGALRLFSKRDDLPSVRAAIGERITSTPGVIRTAKSSLDVPIIIDFFDPRPAALKPIIRDLIKTRTDPGGVECTPADVYRHLRTLRAGFWYEPVPRYPEPYVRTRRDWNRFVADILAQEVPGLDSPLQVANAVKVGKLDDFGWLDKWKREKAKYKGKQVERWVTDDALLACVPTKPSIIWTEFRATGRRLSKLTGLKYFSDEGMSGKDYIEDADPNTSIIASIGANSEGRNLQAWSRNIVVTPPANGRTWEQLIGRTHRTGQLSSEVHFSIMLGHGAVFEHFHQAVHDARFIASTLRQEQKLLIADITRNV